MAFIRILSAPATESVRERGNLVNAPVHVDAVEVCITVVKNQQSESVSIGIIIFSRR